MCVLSPLSCTPIFQTVKTFSLSAKQGLLVNGLWYYPRCTLPPLLLSRSSAVLLDEQPSHGHRSEEKDDVDEHEGSLGLVLLTPATQVRIPAFRHRDAIVIDIAGRDGAVLALLKVRPQGIFDPVASSVDERVVGHARELKVAAAAAVDAADDDSNSLGKSVSIKLKKTLCKERKSFHEIDLQYHQQD